MSDLDKFIDLLGYRVHDLVTGFCGVAESVSFDLYGCVQVAVKPASFKKDGDQNIPDGRWFDYHRLVKMGGDRVMDIPGKMPFRIKDLGGPADLPPRPRS